MDEFTGGQWLGPVIILLLVLAGLSSIIVKKSKSKKLKNWLDYSVYGLMIILDVVFWIWSFKKRLGFFTPAFYTAIILYLIISELTKKYEDKLSQRLGPRYSWLKMGITLVYILVIVFLLLMEGNFSVVSWIISGIVLIVFIVIAWAFDKR